MKDFFNKKSVLFVLIFMCAFSWGASFVAMTWLLEYMDAFQILAVRWTIAVLFLFVLSKLRLIKLELKGKPVLPLFLTGLMQPVIYAVCEIYGVKYTTSSESAIFIATIPLMVLVLGMLFFKTKSSGKAIAAIIIAFAGIFVSVYFSPGFTIGGGKLLGYGTLLIAVLSAGFYSHFSSKAGEFYSPLETTYGMAIMAMIAFNAVNFAKGYGFSGYIACITDIRLAAGILFLGIMCSCFCYIVYNLCVKKIKPIIASNLISNSTTAIGVILGCVIAGDPFGWYTAVGVCMIIAGVCLASTVEQ